MSEGSSRKEIEKLIDAKQRRLGELKLQEAIKGYSTEPSILIEIKDLESELPELKEKLRKLKLEGSKIIELLEQGLDQDYAWLRPSSPRFYKQAHEALFNNPNDAVKTCDNVLTDLEQEPTIQPIDNSLSGESLDIDALKYTKGKFYLLLGCIHLNQNNLRGAEQNYQKSQNEFAGRAWPQLTSLALLGLAIAYRKQKKALDAERAVKAAEDKLLNPTYDKNLQPLERAIDLEKEEIRKLEKKDPIPSPPKPPKKRIFDIRIGEKIVAEKAFADLNLLGYRDYENYERRTSTSLGDDEDVQKFIEKLGLDAQDFTYILEISRDVETNGYLRTGDRLLIAEQKEPKALNNKKVAVLKVEDLEDEVSKNEVKLHVDLMTFFKAAHDHYFLQAEQEAGESIVITGYESAPEQITTYYEQYRRGGAIKHKIAYDIRISGEVKGIVRQGTLFDPYGGRVGTPMGTQTQADSMIWKLPIVKNLEAGADQEITNNEIESYLYLSTAERGEANFGVRVEDNSMEHENLRQGDIALICQKTTLKTGSIAAIVLDTEEMGKISLLRRYKTVDRHDKNLRHSLFEAASDSGKNYVAMEKGVNHTAIRAKYQELIASDSIEFLVNPDLVIVGEVVGVHKEV